MFDAEKLLGKIVREVTGSSYGKKNKKYNKKQKGHKSQKSHSNPLLSGLKSGAGLMTAIGLGIGAYEILKNTSKPAPQTPAAGQTYPPPAPPQPGQQMSPPPPPLSSQAPQTPPAASVTKTVPPQAAPPSPEPQITGISTEALAIQLIRTMVAAAHADGTMDEQEEKAIIERMKGNELSQEERMFLLTELHNPQTIDQLTAGITDPSAAKAMYMLAASTIEIDTDAERQWMDQLAGKLGISKVIQAFIEEQA